MKTWRITDFIKKVENSLLLSNKTKEKVQSIENPSHTTILKRLIKLGVLKTIS